MSAGGELFYRDITMGNIAEFCSKIIRHFLLRPIQGKNYLLIFMFA